MIWNLSTRTLSLLLGDDCLYPARFVNGRNHWDHYFQISLRRSPDQGTNLRAKKRLKFGINPHRTITEKGIFLRRQLQIFQRLVTADIQSSDDYRTTASGCQRPAIDFKLFVLLRRRFAVEKKHFGAEEADAFRPRSNRCSRFVGAGDVGGNFNAMTMDGHRIEVAANI